MVSKGIIRWMIGKDYVSDGYWDGLLLDGLLDGLLGWIIGMDYWEGLLGRIIGVKFRERCGRGYIFQ